MAYAVARSAYTWYHQTSGKSFSYPPVDTAGLQSYLDSQLLLWPLLQDATRYLSVSL